MANSEDIQGLLAKLQISQEQLLLKIDAVQQALQSYDQLRMLWADFEDKSLSHFQLVDQIISLPEVNELYRAMKNEKILEFLRFNLKDLKVKLLFLIDAYSAIAQGNKFKMFPVEFLQFSQNLVAQIKLEQIYILEPLKLTANKIHKG